MTEAGIPCCELRPPNGGVEEPDAVAAALRRRRLGWARGFVTSSPAAHPSAHETYRRDRTRPQGWWVNVELVDRERVRRGWTQRQLARSAQVDPGTLSDLLACRRRPTLGTVQAVCTALNMTLADVITFPFVATRERSIAY